MRDDQAVRGAVRGGEGRSLLLNASEAFRNLYGVSSVPANAPLSVSLVTRALYEGVDAYATVEEVQPEKVQIDIVDLAS